MATEYALRMGDGKRIFLTKEKIMEEIEAGTANAADLGEIPTLNANEVDKLAEILMMPGKAVSVEQGMEVPVTHDIGTIRLDGDQGISGVGIPSSLLVFCMMHERSFAHGFNVHYIQVVPRTDVDVMLVAPIGPGHRVLSEYLRGGGVHSLIAVHEDKSG